MNLRFRILIGICFLIGALVFMAQKELLYALAFLLVHSFIYIKEWTNGSFGFRGKRTQRLV